MKALIQRVTRASVAVEGRTVGAIDHGLLALVGVEKGDDEAAEDLDAQARGGGEGVADGGRDAGGGCLVGSGVDNGV